MSDHFGKLCMKGLDIVLTSDDATFYGRTEKRENESANLISILRLLVPLNLKYSNLCSVILCLG